MTLNIYCIWWNFVATSNGTYCSVLLVEQKLPLIYIINDFNCSAIVIMGISFHSSLDTGEL